MYEQPITNNVQEMKDNLVNINNIKIKLVKANFFSYDNMYTISSFIDTPSITITSIDLGVDKVVKFYAMNMNPIVYKDIDMIMNKWLFSYMEVLKSILTEEEIEFVKSHYFLLYQKEAFPIFNTINIRI